MDLGLAGRTALVTGGSRGIGRVIALTLAGEGADLAICGRDAGALDRVAGEVREFGAACLPVTVDLSDVAGCTTFVEAAVAEFGRIDVLVNNATAEAGASSLGADEGEVVRRIWDKTLPGIRCSRLAASYLSEAPDGSIVFIGGLAARVPVTPYGPFMGMGESATALPQGLGNSTVSTFAKYLSDQLGSDGIRVNVVHPSIVITDRIHGRLDRYAQQTGTSKREALGALDAQAPIGRVPNEHDVAATVVFLASQRASAVSGESIAVDGGLSRGVAY